MRTWTQTRNHPLARGDEPYTPFHAMTLAEVAERFGCPRTTVQSIEERALRKIGEALAAMSDDPADEFDHQQYAR